jgi:hypothetical protein
MGEYEDSYPEAYRRREETAPRKRHFLGFGFGLPRQVRDAEPAVAEARDDAASVAVVNIDAADDAARIHPPQPARAVERPRQPLVRLTPPEIRDDIAQQLSESPFIDESDISVTVDGSAVTLAHDQQPDRDFAGQGIGEQRRRRQPGAGAASGSARKPQLRDGGHPRLT